jgi:hypothetical protein
LLNHFRKNPPNSKAIAKAGDLPTQDPTQRMQERYAGNPFVSAPEGPTRGPIPASTMLSPESQKRLAAMIRNRGVSRDVIAEAEEDRQNKIIAERRGLK